MFMWEKNIESFEDLYERTDAAAAHFNELNSRNKAAESQMVANLAAFCAAERTPVRLPADIRRR